jgi:hypothetical protein
MKPSAEGSNGTPARFDSQPLLLNMQRLFCWPDLRWYREIGWSHGIG